MKVNNAPYNRLHEVPPEYDGNIQERHPQGGQAVHGGGRKWTYTVSNPKAISPPCLAFLTATTGIVLWKICSNFPDRSECTDQTKMISQIMIGAGSIILACCLLSGRIMKYTIIEEADEIKHELNLCTIDK